MALMRSGVVLLNRGLPRSRLYCLTTSRVSCPQSIFISSKNESKINSDFNRQMSSSPSVKLAQLDAPFFKPELVIFDKDGTLVCFHTMWTPWCTSLAERINQATGIDMSDDVYEMLGYDHGEQRVKMGVLAENTHTQIKDKLEELLKNHPELCPTSASHVLEKSWKDTPENMKIKLTGNLHAVFLRLKRHGVKIAICTSDSREGTEQFLGRENLTHFVDLIVCGDDKDSKPKPDPYNALLICKKLSVEPSKTIMVGDTPADTLMGQQAKLGLTVGVLTGIGNQHELSDADVIVSDVHECIDMILPKTGTEGKSKTVFHVTTRGISKIAMGSMFLQGDSPIGFGKRRFSTTSFASGYSHIVVGAGSAGCVLTNRLSEDSNNSVLLLEAGPKDTLLGSKMLQWKIHMPAALMYNLCDDKYNWYYHTEPQKHCNNRVMYWPRGRVWGGSSSLNAMVYVRGHALDYDRWAQEGATGWDYSRCLPYFKKAQSHELGEDDYRGGDGPLYVSRGTSGNILHKVFIDAGKQAGHAYSEDLNGFRQEGVGWFDMTIKKGERWSAATAYLRPAMATRSNIKVTSKVLVTRVIFSGHRAVGVEYVDENGQTKQEMAEQEVILSGGAINSPQLLLLSGVGDADHLKSLDIPVVHHLPGVGQNLQDHIEMYVAHQCKQPLSLLKYQSGLPMIWSGIKWFLNQTGPSATTHLESGGFARTETSVPHPDVQLHFLPSQVIDHGRKAPFLEAFQVHIGPMRATSRGWIKLRSRDPKQHPIIEPNYLSTERDRWEMRQCVRLSREIFAQSAFDPYRGPELAPGSDLKSDAELDAFVREKLDSAYHPSCSCKMGDENDPMAVVGPDTKVLGLDGLRVVDASIMPSIVSGNLNGPTIMIAEKAADIIRQRAPLPPSNAPVYKSKIE